MDAWVFWVILAVVMIIGGLVRHFFNLKNQGRGVRYEFLHLQGQPIGYFAYEESAAGQWKLQKLYLLPGFLCTRKETVSLLTPGKHAGRCDS